MVTLWDAPVARDEVELTEDDQRLVEGWMPDEPFGAGHARQLRHILDTMAADRDPYVPGREAREAVDCILAVYDAARSGAGVSLQDRSRRER